MHPCFMSPLKGCKNVLDAACGTGVDSVMLLEEGFRMASSDASDNMLKTAYKIRWDRRREEAFDQWVIEKANWLILEDAMKEYKGAEGFDAIICLGNSFSELPDLVGDQHDQKTAIANFHSLLKPGGVLIIDHRNYDHILKHGHGPSKNIYYNSKHVDVTNVSIEYINYQPNKVNTDFKINIPGGQEHNDQFRLSAYPHRVQAFTQLLQSIFGDDAHDEVFGDFKPFDENSNEAPGFFIHMIEKQAST